MGKYSVKILSIMVIASLILSSFSVISFAYKDDDIVFEDIWSIDAIEIGPDNGIDDSGKRPNTFFGTPVSNPDDFFLFYNQLTQRQKLIYDTILEQIDAALKDKNDNIHLKESYDVSFTEENYIVTQGTSGQDAFNKACQAVFDDLVMAYSALAEDHMYIFWGSGLNIGYPQYQSSSLGSQAQIKITSCPMMITINTNSYANFNEIEEKYYEMMAAAETFRQERVKGKNRYEKVKSIHDGLCEIIFYQEGPMAHQPTGALLKTNPTDTANHAVCEGYAESFKLICDMENIPTITVVDSGHKWNYVKMDDGRWYVLDATWDDQTEEANNWRSPIYYDFFLVGKKSYPVYFDSTKADEVTHSPTGELFGGFSLTYPVRADYSYTYGVVRPNQKDISIDYTNDVIYVGKNYQPYEVQGGIACPITGIFVQNKNADTTFSKAVTVVTGNEVTHTRKDNNNLTQSYTLILRGDIDGNSRFDTTDVKNTYDVASGTMAIDKNSVEYTAGDINQDGVIDGFDAIVADLYNNNQYKFN